MESMKEWDKKKTARLLRAAYCALSKHKFIASPIQHTFKHFLSGLLVSKPHTKNSSALDYMNIV